ncbi:TlpA family protein disulfide reductase [Azospirillum picis]|uniref:Thiol-disulfide isomerase/thioredoxin n=1 Tax=Azospirillum picis TaxID=488438 RepID=A0ABU0MCN4_9PROT|nr:TlpA disulfide reductase family protein [Azospirillum picis]MBP2297789.1 thiol-disulfide isomerase/thioredoxin [Azospirillum picis]MDQ0531188.1 thiol-disulfide isomerase/thioredoxin [Azospirillum picis]
MAGAGLWWSAGAAPAAPEVVRLGAADAPPAAPAAALPVSSTGADKLEKFREAEPKPMPPLSFVDGEGRRVDLADFKDRVVLLNLWATWCGPCVKEMPSLDRLQAQLGGDRFQVVALSLDRGGQAVVEPFYKKTGVEHLALFLDPGSQSMKTLGLRGLPTTILVDPDGRELGRVEGAVEWDSQEVVAFLRQYLGRGSGPARDRGMMKTNG